MLSSQNSGADATNNPGNSQIRASATANKFLSVGYDTNLNLGYLQGAENGISWRPILLNLNGSATSPVLIGQSTSDGVSKLQVTGAATFSSSVTATGDIRSNAIYRDYQGEALIQTSGSDTQIGSFGAGTPRTISLIAGNDRRLFITTGGNVLIGTTTDNGSRLRVNGSVATPHTTKSANYTLDNTDYTVGFDCASNRTATLPDATTCAGRIYVIYQYNTGTGGSRYVTLDGNGSQTIDGVTTYSLQYQEDFSSVMIQSTGSNWVVIAYKLYPSPL
jgi:hypothetical protein